MGCSLVSHFSSGRSHICKLEGKERKKSFSLISDHPSTLPPLSTASDPTLLHPPPPRSTLEARLHFNQPSFVRRLHQSLHPYELLSQGLLKGNHIRRGIFK
eukprot:TRINITY_DN6434_c0_g1_i3.p1 TRINITY_DN6434_c0_g1~~TRINITY_DN6434_c0_g1_i3.p1  ORF type:complete len:101 (+),score=15.03 TRINITY_DN6434_c0_g1_i3:369-671(+)